MLRFIVRFISKISIYDKINYLGFIDDIFSKQMYFGAALLGLGEIFANISAISLIGSAAPAKGRGAVIGGFSFFGAIGILLVASIGGYLFKIADLLFG